MEVSGPRHAAATLPRKITPVPISKETGWALEPVLAFLRREKSFTSAGFRTSDRPFCREN